MRDALLEKWGIYWKGLSLSSLLRATDTSRSPHTPAHFMAGRTYILPCRSEESPAVAIGTMLRLPGTELGLKPHHCTGYPEHHPRVTCEFRNKLGITKCDPKSEPFAVGIGPGDPSHLQLLEICQGDLFPQHPPQSPEQCLP